MYCVSCVSVLHLHVPCVLCVLYVLCVPCVLCVLYVLCVPCVLCVLCVPCVLCVLYVLCVPCVLYVLYVLCVPCVLCVLYNRLYVLNVLYVLCALYGLYLLNLLCTYLLHVLWPYSSNHPNTVISWKTNTGPITFDVSNNRHVKRVRRAVSGASKNQSVYLLTIQDFQRDKFAGIYSCNDKGGYMTRHFEFKCLGEYSTASQCVQTCVLYVRTVCMYKRVSCMYSMYVQTCVMYVCTVCTYKPVSCTYVLYCKMYVRMYVCMQ